MNQEILLVQIAGQVATLSFNRPDKRNSLSPELLVKIHFSLKELAENNTVRAVIFRGVGDKMFSSGFDIASIPTNMSEEIQQILKTHNPMEIALDSIVNFPYPTIAMLNGHCIGLALNLSLCCDLRIAASDIKVGMPPAKLGAVYPADGIRKFIEVLGVARAKEMFFTGNTYGADQLKELGLVNYIVDRGNLEMETSSLANTIAENAPLSLSGMKKIFNLLSNKQRLDGGDKDHAEEIVNQAYHSKDLCEGQMAFLQKRKPKFCGK